MDVKTLHLRSSFVKSVFLAFTKTVMLLFLVVLIYLLTALGFFGAARLNTAAVPKTEQSIPIYLFADDFHADLMIPIDPMQPKWDYLLATKDFPVPRAQIKLLSFGWGSNEFYLKMREWSQLSLGLGLKALAFDATVMHVTAYRNDAVKTDHPMVSRRYINREGYQRLLDFIRRSHKLGKHQHATHIPNMGYRANDTFFVANGRYHPLRTCNQWTGEALRQAGINAPLWAPFPHALKWALREQGQP